MCLVHPPTDVADRVDPSAQEATREAAETRRHLGRPNVGCACSAHTCSAALRLVGPPRPSWAIRRQPHSLVRCPQLWGQAVEVAPGRSSHATPSMGWRRRRPWRTQLPTSGAHLPRRKGASETLRSHPVHRTMNGASAAKPPYSENALLSRAAPGACARARCLPEHASKARHFSGSPWPRRNFSAVLAVEGLLSSAQM